MDVEGSGDLADGPPLIKQLVNEFLLVGAHLWRSAKCDAALARVNEAVSSSLTNEGALELRNAGENREDHAPGRARGIGPWLIKRL